MAFIQHDGKVINIYDKKNLVAFGEYIPFNLSKILNIFKITAGTQDFTAGETYRTIHIHPDIPDVLALICYDILFSESIFEQDKAKWVVNITNDSWFKNSIGIYQHLHIAQTRAIEFGLPVIRNAYTGISTTFDAYGRMLDSIPYNQQKAVQVFLPQDGKSLFRQYGYKYLWILYAILTITSCVIILYSYITPKKIKNKE